MVTSNEKQPAAESPAHNTSDGSRWNDSRSSAFLTLKSSLVGLPSHRQKALLADLAHSRLFASYAVSQYFTVIQQLRSRLWEVDIMALQAGIHPSLSRYDEEGLKRLRNSIIACTRVVEAKIQSVKLQLRDLVEYLNRVVEDPTVTRKSSLMSNAWPRLVLLRDDDENVIKVVEEAWDFLSDSLVIDDGSIDTANENKADSEKGNNEDDDHPPTPNGSHGKTKVNELDDVREKEEKEEKEDVDLINFESDVAVSNWEDSLVCVESLDATDVTSVSTIGSATSILTSDVTETASIQTPTPTEERLNSTLSLGGREAPTYGIIPVDERQRAVSVAVTPSSTPRRRFLRGLECGRELLEFWGW